MTRQQGNWFNDEWQRQGQPTNGTFVETFPRYLAQSDLDVLTGGVELAVAVPLNPGDLVTNITFVVGGTEAGTPTAGYACLRSPAGALLAQTASFGSTARAADTAYTVALATPQLITTAGMYLVGISFTASVMPSLVGRAVDNAAVAGAVTGSAVVLAKTHGSSVGATAPATTVTPTTVVNLPYVVLT